MTLQAIGGDGGYDYVQDTEPSNPDTGETWYDESESDARNRSKIYANVGNGDEWVVIPSLEQSDILSDGTPFDGGNIDAPISEAGGGVDWADKTPKFDGGKATESNEDAISISGSGYIVGASFAADDYPDRAQIVIDDTEYIETAISDIGAANTGASDRDYAITLPLNHRFESNLALGADKLYGTLYVGCYYVLD